MVVSKDSKSGSSIDETFVIPKNPLIQRSEIERAHRVRNTREIQTVIIIY